MKTIGDMNNPPGWIQDENGAWFRETVHRMDRRCRNWDYCGTGTYMITMQLNDRKSRAFGEVAGPPAQMKPSEFGNAILAHVARLSEFTPEIEVLGVQLMPDHLHMVLRVMSRMSKKLGSQLCGFKGGCTKIARSFGVIAPGGSAMPPTSPGGNVCPGGSAMPSTSPGGNACPGGNVMPPTSPGGNACPGGSAMPPTSPGGNACPGGNVMPAASPGGNVCPGGSAMPSTSPGGNACPGGNARVSRGNGIFADGFVDTILFDADAVRKALAYLEDNPRRLLEKRMHPELFRVLRDLQVPLAIGGKMGTGHFAAIGNHNLLKMPNLLQVQCSRRDFAYRTDASGALLKNAAPAVCTSAFSEKADELIAAASHGAVLVSPCISHGEKEIAARAFKVGLKVITLQNKGFSNLYKPGGKLFDTCAAGNLLMLAPAAWPYLPGHKPITRVAACALNHIAQLIAGPGAAQINYRGMLPNDIESVTAASVNWAPA